MPVDSFKYLPRLIATFYRMTERQPDGPIPWTPLPRPLAECTLGLVTSGGLYSQGEEPPFDLERERREPTWGDPSYRTLPVSIRREQIGVSHLHFNREGVLEDFNILLPIERCQELAEEGLIAALTEHHYSFMGYQGFPPDTRAWERTYGPEVAEKLKSEGAHAVLLVPA